MSNYGSKTPSGNSRIYNCVKCSKAFTREEHLTRHILSTHNKLKPFVCGICSRPFSRRDLLLRHAKNLHEGLEKSISRIRKIKHSDQEDDQKTNLDKPELANMGNPMDNVKIPGPHKRSNSEGGLNINDNVNEMENGNNFKANENSANQADGINYIHLNINELSPSSNQQPKSESNNKLKMSVNMLIT